VDSLKFDHKIFVHEMRDGFVKVRDRSGGTCRKDRASYRRSRAPLGTWLISYRGWREDRSAGLDNEVTSIGPNHLTNSSLNKACHWRILISEKAVDGRDGLDAKQLSG
jgi:hypothetical protein